MFHKIRNHPAQTAEALVAPSSIVFAVVHRMLAGHPSRTRGQSDGAFTLVSEPVGDPTEFTL